MVEERWSSALAEAVAPSAREGRFRGFLLLAPHLHLSCPFLAPGVGSMGGGAGNGVDRASLGCPPAEEAAAAEEEAEEEGLVLP